MALNLCRTLLLLLSSLSLLLHVTNIGLAAFRVSAGGCAAIMILIIVSRRTSSSQASGQSSAGTESFRNQRPPRQRVRHRENCDDVLNYQSHRAWFSKHGQMLTAAAAAARFTTYTIVMSLRFAAKMRNLPDALPHEFRG